MLMQPNALKILLCTAPTDMRKSINGLCFLVDGDLGENPSCGTVYVFCNRAKDKLKLLYWDGNGFCLLYTRLEKGRFKIPRESHSLSISSDELRWLLQGIDFKSLPKPKVLEVKTYV
jgi:transposase